MNESNLLKLGKWILEIGKFRICIVDDEEVYFPPLSLHMADLAGYGKIERHMIIDEKLLTDLIENPRDVVILDIINVCDKKIAKDGLAIADLLYKRTKSYIVIKSAHSYVVGQWHKSYDYIISDPNMLALDFVKELNIIVEDYLKRKTNFYGKILIKIGFFMIRKAKMPDISF